MPTDHPSRRPGRPKAADTAAIQARILAVAQRLFFEQGFAATGMESVAREAGMTKQTLYARFPNKDELYRAVIDGVIAAWRADQGALVGDYTTLEEALYQHTLRTLQTATREGSALLGHFLNAEAGRNPEVAQAVLGPVRSQGIKDIAAILEAFPNSGGADRQAAAEYYFICLAGKINDLNNFRDEVGPGALAAWAKTAVRLFLGGYLHDK